MGCLRLVVSRSPTQLKLKTQVLNVEESPISSSLRAKSVRAPVTSLPDVSEPVEDARGRGKGVFACQPAPNGRPICQTLHVVLLNCA